MGSLESEVTILVLCSLLVVVIISVLFRFCRGCRNMEPSREEPSSQDTDRIKSHIIQMALLNATTTTLLPFMQVKARSI